MKQKRKILIIIITLIVIALSFLGGRTFSKYTSEVKGTGTAEIANWVFKVNGNEEVVKTINLFSTHNDETLVNNKIAPGTKGSFDILIDATGSDVGVEYNVKFSNETERPQNLIFKCNDKSYNSIKELEKDLIGTISANEENKTRTITIEWEWKYETGSSENEISKNDNLDTKNAKEIQQYTFDINVAGTQVVPK